MKTEFQSKTVYGLLVSVIIAVAKAIGYDVPLEVGEATLTEILLILSTAYTLYGMRDAIAPFKKK